MTGEVVLDVEATLKSFRIKEVKEAPGGQVVTQGLNFGISVGGIGITWCVSPVVELRCNAKCNCPGWAVGIGWKTSLSLPELCHTTKVGVAVGPGVKIDQYLDPRKMVRLIKLLKFAAKHGGEVLDAGLMLALLIDVFGLERMLAVIKEGIGGVMDAMKLVADGVCKLQFEAMLLGGVDPCPCLPR